MDNGINGSTMLNVVELDSRPLDRYFEVFIEVHVIGNQQYMSGRAINPQI